MTTVKMIRTDSNPGEQQPAKSLVRVITDYTYCPQEGGTVVRLKAGEEWNLLDKSRDDYWLVSKDGSSKMAYIPVGNIEELAPSVRHGSLTRPPKPKPKPRLSANQSLEGSVLKELNDILDSEELEFLSPGSRASIGEMESHKRLSGASLDNRSASVTGRYENVTISSCSVEAEQLPAGENENPLNRYPPPDYDDKGIDEEDYINLADAHKSDSSRTTDAVESETSDYRSDSHESLDAASSSYQPVAEGTSVASDYQSSSLTRKNRYVEDEVECNYANLADIQKHIKMMATRSDSSTIETSETPISSPDVCTPGSDLNSEIGSPCLTSKEDLTPDAPIPKMKQKHGHLHLMKIKESGKKSKKSWSLAYVYLHESKLYFFKDQKLVLPDRTLDSFGKEEWFLDLRGAAIEFTLDKSKKEVLWITTVDQSEFYLHHIDSKMLQGWLQAINSNIIVRQLFDDTHRSQGDSEAAQSSKKALALTHSIPQPLSAERVKYADKLRQWLKRRPSRDTIRARGIYKDVVFGMALSKLCQQDANNVPRFVRECIDAVESKGLDVSGIYRIGGNITTVQKLRLLVDQREYYDLHAPEWEIHAITSAFKLFLRELPEPLFTISLSNKFLEAFVTLVGNRPAQVSSIQKLLHQLPRCNYETLKAIFNHLDSVRRHSQHNQMYPQNLAIVFGPTLLWTHPQSENMAVSVVQQGQLVEMMILECRALFA